MENVTIEQATAVVYEPPALVELGKFSQDTLGTMQAGKKDSVKGRKLK